MPRRRGPARGAALLALLLAAAGAAGAVVAGTAGWEETRAAFLAGVAGNDVEAALDALEGFAIHDRPEAAQVLVDVGLPHADIRIHRESERLLQLLDSKEAQAVVIEAAKRDKSWTHRADCTRVLAHYMTEESFAALLELIADKRWLVRSEAIRGIAQVREKRSVAALIARLPLENGRLLDDVTDALRQLTGQSFPPKPEQWQSWWDTVGKDQDLPAEAGSDQGERRGLGTAVKQGLYGTVVSERVVFILDVSGSMTAGTELEGTRFEIATRELIRVLEEQVTPKTEFNIVAFSDEAARFRPNLSEGKGANIKKAIEFVNALRPGGETNIFRALELAFQDEEVDTIYLLTDGSPTVGAETIPALIRRKVDEWNRYRGVKIHAIGFFPGDAKHQDKADARTFLLDLTRENRGRYIEIE